MDAQWHLSRHLGIADMAIVHRLGDLKTTGDRGTAQRALAASLLANAETRVVLRQEPDQLDATA